MPSVQAGAPPAVLLAAFLLLPAGSAGLQTASPAEASVISEDLEDLPSIPSPGFVADKAAKVPLATDDPSDVESCARGRLVSKGRRYADRSDRLDILRENCSPCFTNKPDAPLLYIKEGNEGMGSRVQELLTAMAVAARNGMNFGGMVSRGICHKAHNASIVRATRALIRLPNGNDIFTEDPPVFDAVYRGVQNLEENFARGAAFRGPDFRDGANVLVQLRCISCELDGPQWNLTDYWAYWGPDFVSSLRQSAVGLFSQPLVFASKLPSVAMHVRRGDVTAADSRRHTPDSWYFWLADRIKKTLPNADVHVFSSLEGKHDASEFDEYRHRGMTVHLDELDIAKPWAQLARADVLVMAKSSFSHVPALFNNGCVIYEEYWHRPQKDWAVVGPWASDGPSVDEGRLEDCLQRVLERYTSLSM